MLDLKLHDIPATVAGGMRAAARAGAELVTVHALGGPAMLEAAVQAAGDGCRVAAVTILTSARPADLAAAGLPPAAESVPRLAELAVRSGCQAVVCSPLEAAALRDRLGPAVELVCPGVRPAATAVIRRPGAGRDPGRGHRRGGHPDRRRAADHQVRRRGRGRQGGPRPGGRGRAPGGRGRTREPAQSSGALMVDLTLCEHRRVLTSADRLWPTAKVCIESASLRSRKRGHEEARMPLPTLTPEQRQQALEKAAEARRKRAELKAQLKSGNTSLSTVLAKDSDETVGKMKVSSVLESMPGRRQGARPQDHGEARHLRLPPGPRPRLQAEGRPARRVRRQEVASTSR